VTKNPDDRMTLGIPLDEQTVEFTVSLFAALAHPTRLRIVELLTERGHSVSEIAAALGLRQPNASLHLAILSRAGVVKATQDGTTHCFSLRGPRIARILQLVDEFRSIHASALQHEAGSHE